MFLACFVNITFVVVWLTLFWLQTLMLSCALEGDVLRGFDEIQKQVNSKQSWIDTLSTKWAAYIDKAKALEARVVELEKERVGLRDEVWTLQGLQTDLETEV